MPLPVMLLLTLDPPVPTMEVFPLAVAVALTEAGRDHVPPPVMAVTEALFQLDMASVSDSEALKPKEA